MRLLIFMDSVLSLELSPDQLELLQEGLRYVRSSRKLALREPLAPPDAQREADLRQIKQLMDQLSVGSPHRAETKN